MSSFSESHTNSVLFAFLTHKRSSYDPSNFLEFVKTISLFATSSKDRFQSFIFDENLFNKDSISLVDQIKSKMALSLVMNRTHYYIRDKQEKRYLVLFLSVLRALKGLGWIFSKERRGETSKQCIRMANMTIGHLSILEEFIKSDRDFAVVFEDDSSFDSQNNQSVQLLELLKLFTKFKEESFFANISDSFSLEQLGATHLIESKLLVLSESGERDQILYSMRRPITNTTCVVVYSRRFANLILEYARTIQSNKDFIYLPFDWLFNLILVQLHEHKVSVQCFHNEPGIFKQGSLHNPISA